MIISIKQHMIHITEYKNKRYVQLQATELLLQKPQDAGDLVGHCFSEQADGLIIFEENIHPDFFELKTKLAGEVMQKFSTYRLQLAIIGDFTKYESKSLRDFMYESNKAGHTIFAKNIEEALSMLTT